MLTLCLVLLCQKDPPKDHAVPTATVGEITVRVPFATVSKIRYQTRRSERIRRTEKPLLTILVEVDSRTPNRLVKYKGWASDEPAQPWHATLKDEHGNVYDRARAPAYERFWYQAREATSIHPKVAFHDELVFEPPIDTAKKLILTLPGDAVGLDKDFTLTIDADMLAYGDLDAVRDARWFLEEMEAEQRFAKRQAEHKDDADADDRLREAERKLAEATKDEDVRKLADEAKKKPPQRKKSKDVAKQKADARERVESMTLTMFSGTHADPAAHLRLSPSGRTVTARPGDVFGGWKVLVIARELKRVAVTDPKGKVVILAVK